MRVRNILVICAIIITGTGCTPEKFSSNKKVNGLPTKTAWTQTKTNVERFTCAPPDCQAKIIIYRFPKNAYSWHFQNLTAPRTVAGHLAADPKAVFTVNGVYFDEKNEPTGLLIAGGKIVGEKKYETNKSAILELAPDLRIINTAKEKFNTENFTEAAQSYPLLIASGVLQKVANEKTARRTFVGDDNQNNIYFGIIPDDEVTLADAAALVQKSGVAWNNVLNLDGGPSTGLASTIPGSVETTNSITQVPNAIIGEIK